MEKGVRNARRKQPDNDKIGRKFRTEATEKQAAKARQTERLIERLDVVDEPRKEWQLRMEIAAAPRAGAIVASLRGAVVRRGTFTLGPIDLQIDWADRVAITGANGSGKTTLLRALLGQIPLDEGHAALGASVVVGEIGQARDQFLGGEPLLDAFRAAVPGLAPADARTLLAKFGLRAEHVLRPASTLSPGSAPGPRWRCCRAAAPTSWSWTSPPTTSTCPRSSSSNRRWPPTRARSCWSPTTAGCSTRS